VVVSSSSVQCRAYCCAACGGTGAGTARIRGKAGRCRGALRACLAMGLAGERGGGRTSPATSACGRRLVEGVQLLDPEYAVVGPPPLLAGAALSGGGAVRGAEMSKPEPLQMPGGRLDTAASEFTVAIGHPASRCTAQAPASPRAAAVAGRQEDQQTKVTNRFEQRSTEFHLP